LRIEEVQGDGVSRLRLAPQLERLPFSGISKACAAFAANHRNDLSPLQSKE
jgi:hypothetical protein